MLLTMVPVRIRVTPLAGYLLVLAVYSCFMCISTLRDYQEKQEGNFVNENVNDYEERGIPSYKGHKLSRSFDPPKFNGIMDFFNWLASPETDCRKLLRFGGTTCRTAMDHDKNVCFDPDVALDPRNCNVYSFGIGHDSTFDDAINYFGCEVSMFDPTISNDIKKNLLKKQKFYHLGLAASNFTIKHDITYFEDNTTEAIVGHYDTYDGIRNIIGHQGKTIHYLKADIEKAEWVVIPYLSGKGLLDGVLQIAIEIHTMDIIKLPPHEVVPELQKYARILSLLRKEGFQRVIYRPTLVYDTLYYMVEENRTIPTCGEVLYIRRGSRLTP